MSGSTGPGDVAGLSRRAVLRGAAAATVAATGLLTAACTTSSASASAPRTGSAVRPGGPTRADWRALAHAIDGDVVRRADPDFAQTTRLFDPRFDGRRPLAVVEAVSARDVSEAIRFAGRFGLRCRARAGGHSYVGDSTVDNGLVIDVRRMQATHYDPASGHATVGAGAQLYSVHAALAAHGRSIPTGTCPTVGAAGLTLGGGLGVDSRSHGLTCDRLRSLTIVTADGVVRTASPTRNADLFWACQGGGGGNLGIVTSLRLATHAAQGYGFFLVSFPWSAASRVLAGWTHRVHRMPRSSWMNLHLEAFGDGSTRARVVGVCRPGDEDVEAAAVQREAGVDASSVSTFRKDFLDGIAFLGGGTTSPRTAFAAGSDVVASMTARLAHALPRIVAARAASGQAAAVILDPLTGAVQDRRPGATAFPWRRHLADIQWYVGLPSHPSRRQVQAAYGWIRQAHAGIGGASAGAYVNYLEPGRPVGDYHGANAGHLRRVKHRYDPSGFFRSPYTI